MKSKSYRIVEECRQNGSSRFYIESKEGYWWSGWKRVFWAYDYGMYEDANFPTIEDAEKYISEQLGRTITVKTVHEYP